MKNIDLKYLEKFAEEYPDAIDWYNMPFVYNLSEQFIKKFSDRIDFEGVIRHQKLSEQFIIEFITEIDLCDAILFQKLSDDFILKYCSINYKEGFDHITAITFQNISIECKAKLLEYIKNDTSMAQDFINKTVNNSLSHTIVGEPSLGEVTRSCSKCNLIATRCYQYSCEEFIMQKVLK